VTGSMTSRVLQLAATAVLAAALWVVPSVGTRGQGTLGDRFVHPDRSLLTAVSPAETARERAALTKADAMVARAVGGL
jgi:hypothetical protein